MRSVRVTAFKGGTRIMPGNYLGVYFDLWVVVWLTVVGLKMAEEAARHPRQLP